MKKWYMYIGIITAALMVCVFVGCSTHKASPPEVVEPTLTTEPENNVSIYVDMSVNGYHVLLDPTLDGNWIEVMSMAADAPNDFALGPFAGYSCTIQGQIIHGEESIQVEIEDGILRKSRGIEIVFTNIETGVSYTQYVRELNEGFPVLEVYSNGADRGFYYFEPTLDWICKMDTDGNIIYYKYSVDNFNDFCPYLSENGEVYYGYRIPYANEDVQYLIASSALTPSKQVIMDQNYHVVDEIYGYINEKGSYNKWALDCHDFIFIDLGHYITLTYEPIYVYNIPENLKSREGFPVRVIATVIQEVQNGEVLFTWRSTDYPELYEYSSEDNSFDNNQSAFCDYIHTNSMAICPNDGNIVLSMRHNDSIMEIDRLTGEIKWILGGKGDMFGLTDEQKTTRQHFARFTEDGTLTVFDNDTEFVLTNARNNEYVGTGSGHARAVEYVIDEDTHELLGFSSYEYGLYIGEFMGSAQKTGENRFLLGWGGTVSHAPTAIFSEIDFDAKDTLFEVINLTTGQATQGGNMTYRVNKAPF